jgi:hypothetical protein
MSVENKRLPVHSMYFYGKHLYAGTFAGVFTVSLHDDLVAQVQLASDINGLSSVDAAHRHPLMFPVGTCSSFFLDSCGHFLASFRQQPLHLPSLNVSGRECRSDSATY